jgi:hypothetical protein
MLQLLMKRHSKALPAVCCTVSLVFICAGCGQKGPKMAPVKGRVELNGQPLKTGNVITIPDAGRGAKGPIQADGTFELGTYQTRDGAIVGTHKVGVIAVDQPSNLGPEADAGRSLIPTRYNNPESSQLTIEVKADEENTPTLELTSK